MRTACVLPSLLFYLTRGSAICACLIAPATALAVVDAAVTDATHEDALIEDAGIDSNSDYVVKAQLEPNEVALGQRFELVVEIWHQDDQQIAAPTRSDNADIAVLATAQRSQRVEGSRVVEIFRLPLAAFKIKEVRTPALSFATSDGDTLEVAPLPVRVIRQLEQSKQAASPADAASPIVVERFDERPVAFAALLLLATALLAFSWWWSRKRRPETAISIAKPPERPADVVALERLAQLQATDLVARGELTRFVDAAVEILRWYLGQRYGLTALDQTSTELLSNLRRVLDASLDARVVERILFDADLVKFARAETTNQACAQLLDQARELIRATRMPRAMHKEAAA